MTPEVPSDPPRRFAQIARGSFAYTDEGTGPCIVLVHGIPGSARDYRWLSPALGLDVRVVRLDMPGYGQTPRATALDETIDSRGAFVAAAIEALGIQRCLVAGHSMGGTTATAAAVLLRDRIAALALLSSVGLRPHQMLRRFPGGSGISRLVDLPLIGPLTRRAMRIGFRATGFPPQTTLDDVAQTARILGTLELRTHVANLKALTLPTMVAWADDDAFIEPAIFEALALAVPDGPRLRWPTGGHNIQKSHAVELAAALRPMLQKL